MRGIFSIFNAKRTLVESCYFTHSVWFYTQWVFFHPVLISHCFVASKFLSRIYALLRVKFPGLKMCWCKKNDKYEVCPNLLIANLYTPCNDRHKCMNWLLIFAVVRQQIVWKPMNHLVITWWPLLDHLLAAWWPLWDHFKIPGWSLGDLFVSTCWPF